MSLCAGLGSKPRLSKLCMRKGMFLKFKLFISFHITVTKSSTKEKSANAWTDSWKSKLADCKHMYKTLKLLDFIIFSRLTMHDQWGTIRRNRTTRQNQIKNIIGIGPFIYEEVIASLNWCCLGVEYRLKYGSFSYRLATTCERRASMYHPARSVERQFIVIIDLHSHRGQDFLVVDESCTSIWGRVLLETTVSI